MSQPGFFFYTGDYLKDTRVLSAEQRGCWTDALCFLNEHGGSVTWPLEAYARYWGVPDNTARCVLDAIAMANVGNVEWQNDSKTIAKLSNRRMVRLAEHEEHNRQHIHEVRSRAGKKGMKKRWQTDNKNNILPSPSLIPEDSLKKENQEPATPEPSAEPAKAGKKELDPRIKAVADLVYQIDRKKFARLIVWIKEAEKGNYMPAVIAAALERFLPHAAEVQNWYPYLDKIIYKTDKDMNAAQHDVEHERLKEETRELSKVIPLRGVVKDA